MKNVIKAALLLMTGLLFTACSNGGKVDDQTAKEYEAKAEEVVDYLNNQEYSKLTPLFDSKMKEALPEEKLKELEPIIAEAGDFESITKSSVEKQDKYYSVILVAKYSNAKLRVTVNYDEQGQVAGLFLK